VGTPARSFFPGVAVKTKHLETRWVTVPLEPLVRVHRAAAFAGLVYGTTMLVAPTINMVKAEKVVFGLTTTNTRAVTIVAEHSSSDGSPSTLLICGVHLLVVLIPREVCLPPDNKSRL
jgi:hypothetical protein